MASQFLLWAQQVPGPALKQLTLLEGDSDSETGCYRDVGAGEGGTGGRVPRSARQHGEGWCVIQTCQFLVTNGTTRGVTASSKASMACDDWELDAVC